MAAHCLFSPNSSDSSLVRIETGLILLDCLVRYRKSQKLVEPADCNRSAGFDVALAAREVRRMPNAKHPILRFTSQAWDAQANLTPKPRDLASHRAMSSCSVCTVHRADYCVL